MTRVLGGRSRDGLGGHCVADEGLAHVIFGGSLSARRAYSWRNCANALKWACVSAQVRVCTSALVVWMSVCLWVCEGACVCVCVCVSLHRNAEGAVTRCLHAVPWGRGVNLAS